MRGRIGLKNHTTAPTTTTTTHPPTQRDKCDDGDGGLLAIAEKGLATKYQERIDGDNLIT